MIVSNLGPKDSMLIGMDIISLGDFAISNSGNRTLFSFVCPPFADKIDLLDKANKINNSN